MLWIAFAFVAVCAYFLGSIPNGYLVAKAKGIDLRRVGSGNIGATNAMRVLGKPLGLLVLLADAGKGALACAVLPPLAVRITGISGFPGEWGMIVAGISSILGHNFTCWLRFKGGKGIATSAGVLLVLMPKALGVCFVAWALVFAASRIVSLASIVAAVVLPIAAWRLGRDGSIILVATMLGVLAIYRHRANIQRLLQGAEPRVGKKTQTAVGGDS